MTQADPTIALLAASFLVAGLAIGCIETCEHAAVATVQSFGNIVASAIAGML